jgi:DNA-binding response OmpR family regulator
MHILVVDDDEKTASFVRKGLEQSSYTVNTATNGDDALAHAITGDYAAIVLDIMLPGRTGLLVVRELRARGHDVPILALTARSALAERLEGLNSGCDDYLPKPFAFDELLARLRALLRRQASATRATRLEYAGLTLDPLTRVVTRDGTAINLTYKEYTLLEVLLRHPGHVVPSSVILESVWGEDFEVGRNVLEVYMHMLRKKVDQGNVRRLLHTVRGVGYVLRDCLA